MRYKVIETADSLLDVQELSFYITEQFKNYEAAENFLDQYDEHIRTLEIFPLGFRGISIGYRGYEVRLMPFDSYNIFFYVNEDSYEVVILRVLKGLRNWHKILMESLS